MKFIVDTKKWVNTTNTNHISNPTLLLNQKGNMCCLGFCLLQMGKEESQISNIGNPKSVGVIKYFSYIKHGIIRNTRLSEKAIVINDSPSKDINEKKKLLRDLFKKHGHSIIFKK